MDCARCQDELTSFLYGESDDLRSAAMRRHLDGCARCRAELDQLRAARDAVRSSAEADPAPELDAPVLAAAARFAKERRAQAASPSLGRGAERGLATAGAAGASSSIAPPPAGPPWARVVSWLGSMAMRPQVAMALLLVLMVGVGLWYLPQARRAAEWMRAEVAADHDDEPSQLASVDDDADAGSAESLGDPGLPRTLDRGQRRWGRRDPATKAAGSLAPSRGSVPGSPRASEPDDDEPEPEAAPSAPVAVAGADAGTASGQGAGATAVGGTVVPSTDPVGASGSAPPEPVADDAYDEPIAANLYARAMNHYRAGRYGEAIDELGAVTRRSDAASLVPRAYLNLARSHRAAGNLPTAARTYETLLSRYPGFGQRSQAMWEAAVIYRRLGQLGRSRALLERLVDVPSHSARARRELVMVNQGERAAEASTVVDPATAVQGGL
ncbi:MAG: tetratricopeptide repeat protein [Deltaproteobacteria bacterium]|nr:tetratricopeptide repeat protein [Deltaproteobacteria bacterium]